MEVFILALTSLLTAGLAFWLYLENRELYATIKLVKEVLSSERSHLLVANSQVKAALNRDLESYGPRTQQIIAQLLGL